MIKRKKNTRQRGSHTHGWGSMKKHRGAGNRGGRGNAGSGKRGDAKKPSFWKDVSYHNGKKGFISLRKALKTINIGDLNKFNTTKINLIEQGFDKLLGKGTVNDKFEVQVSYASDLAIKKIQKAGGTVSGLIEKTIKVKNESQKPKTTEKNDGEKFNSEETVNSKE